MAEPEDRAIGPSSAAAEANKALFLEKVRQSNTACQAGDFDKAVVLYSEAIALDKGNHILYSNRSAAYIKMGQFTKAHQDAVKAKELNSEWPKGYYREGVALQCLGRHAEALAAFSSGLAQDPKSLQLLAGLVEAAMKSPLKGTLEPTYRQLQTMKLDKSPFVIISVIGQELLAQAKYNAAVMVLESALRIGTCSLKLRGSVFSALSSAYWALNSLDKALGYMQQDLVVAKKLGDTAGECRAHGNLGSAYFSKGNYKDALTSNRYQLVLAMKCKDTAAAAAALTSLGHVYTAVCDYPNALASHKQCVELMKQLGNELQEARETGNVGAVYLAMGDFDNAVQCHMDHLALAKRLGNKVEEARAYSNLGSSHHYKRNFEHAISQHNEVLRLAHELRDHTIEARAYAGLGHAARCMGGYNDAKSWHEQQLDMALKTRDRVAEGRACSNLGIVYQLLGDHDAALKLHQAHLNICRQLNDRAGMGRAFGNIGNAYSAMGFYEQAIKYHKQELTISKEVNDRSSEASTHGNLAVAYQALEMHEMATVHYHSHLNIARELKDSIGEACALCNLGNCHSSKAQFGQAVPFYENYLMLSQELNDIEGEAKACHFLGYAHYCLGNYKEAIRYYDQDLALARDLQDRMSMGRAYCNLGLAHAAIGNLDNALECQKYFLAIAHLVKHNQAKYRALANMGDVLIKLSSLEEAIKVYQKQLTLSKQLQDKGCEASSYGSMGVCHRLLRRFDKSLGFHTQELAILQDSEDTAGECRAHGNLGAVHMSLGNNTLALRCFQEQLDRAQELKDRQAEAQALGNMGITRMNLSHFEEAIGNFEQQLGALEGEQGSRERARALGHLGDCLEALGDLRESVRYHERALQLALQGPGPRDQERAYRGLGLTQRALGNLQEALVCFEKRLVITADLGQPSATAAAYGELGDIHRLLGNHEQAVHCMEHRLRLAREAGDEAGEGSAECGLGEVQAAVGQHQAALLHHQQHLAIATRTGDKAAQIKACGNIGATFEALKQPVPATQFMEQLLSVATLVNDRVAKIAAFSSLGRIEYVRGRLPAAVGHLGAGLHLAEQLGRAEDEARLRHRLGLALWQSGDLAGARGQLDRAADLFESIRGERRGSAEGRLGLYDLQTACYQSLQRVLVLQGEEGSALVVAERSRTRPWLDLSTERAGRGGARGARPEDACPRTLEEVEKIVTRHAAAVLYFSLAAGYLYSWLLLPGSGVVRFHQTCLAEEEEEAEKPESEKGAGLLEGHIRAVREALGVEAAEEQEEAGGVWGNHMEELGDRLNQDGDRTGFLRMVNRSSRLNASSYSLSSLFSVGSVGGLSTAGPSTPSRGGSTRSRGRPAWQGPAATRHLYQLLIQPMEDHLPDLPTELMLVLEGDLYLVPFPVLRGANCTDFLCERFSLLVTPSLTSLKTRHPKPRPGGILDPESRSLVVGNPRLPSSVTEHWGWGDIPAAEQEAALVGEILQSEPLLGAGATKEAVLAQLCEAEAVHLACHVSWKLSAVIVAPGELCDSSGGNPSRYSIHSDTIHEEEDVRSEATTVEMPSLSDFLLTAADLLGLRLRARLVVLSSCHTADRPGQATSDGVIGLSRALLAAGAQCVMVSLWPVPDTAVKLIMKAFYSSLLQGAKASRALGEAMTAVQTTKYFQHPANWAGFVLIGQDVRLTHRVAMMGQALREILGAPDRCRDALRVTLHLVEKSLQRINRGYRNAMYTSQKSIEAKVGLVSGWKDLLMSVGFRFEPAANNIPAAVFFPQTDPGERLAQCSASLQAILGLSPTSWAALGSLLTSPDSADEIMAMFRTTIGSFGPHSLEVESVALPVGVRLWRIPGCHELLASLGFDLMEAGRDEVTLKSGKTANKRQVQFALQALVALFDTDAAPRSLDIESSEGSEGLPEGEVEQERAPLPPFPAPRKSSLVLDGSSGAFSSYARNRGEPDGRQHPDSPPAPASPGLQQSPPPPPPPPQGPAYHPKGRESDCNFTPSPVDRLSASTRYLGYSLTGSPSPRSSTLLAGRPRGRHGPSPLSRPDSRSSQSSAQTGEWEGQTSTVRRAPHHSKLSPGVTEPPAGLDFRRYLLATSSSLYETASGPGTPAPVPGPQVPALADRLSPRAEAPRAASRRSQEPGKERPAPAGGATSPRRGASRQEAEVGGREAVLVRDSATPSIQETIISSQMRRINRELPISEVYHERSLGLGLAPPLSKLIMSNNIAVAQVDHHSDAGPGQQVDSMSNFDNLSVIEEAHPTSARRPRPPVPPKPEPWVSAGLIQAELRPGAAQPTRDEGDGRSMTDSQYSGCSPSTGPGDLGGRLGHLRLGKDEKAGKRAGGRSRGREGPGAGGQGREGPGAGGAGREGPAIRPADLSHYINSEFHRNRPPGPGQAGQAQHPHMWDRNGRFTYTGQLSSDC